MRRLYGTWEPSPLMLTEILKRQIRKRPSRNVAGRGGMFRSSDEYTERCWSEGNMLSRSDYTINRRTGRNR